MSISHQIKYEKYRIFAIFISLSIFLFFVYSFNFNNGNFSNLNYSFFGSLFLITFWWKNKTWVAPIIIIIILATLFIISFTANLIAEDIFRLLVLLLVIIIIAFLFERMEKVRILNEMNEKLQKRTDKLEDANKELESFAYSVSHDLRVPLRAIDGFSRIVVEDYEDKLDDEGKRLLGIIRENTKKMGQLIDDILLLSRAGRQEMNFTEINMEELTKKIFEEQKISSNEDNIHLDINNIPPCYGDRVLMQQVLTNLIANSFKFTEPKNDRIIEVGAINNKNETVYYVKDNGVGFDMKYKDKLFGLFQRLHGADEFKGTGVGLSIVQRVIRRHGGTVWGEGKLNEGATFYFSIQNNAKKIL
jgi:light-regulated signal transduction histidine kinase (bacteriophytochrome)